MFDIESAYVDVNAIEEGRWLPLGPDFPGVEVLAKGLTSSGAKAFQAKATREAPRKERLTSGRLTDEAQERILRETIIERCVQDWRGLSSGGEPLVFSKDALRMIMTEPKARRIAAAIVTAITDLETATESAQEQVLGN